MKLCNCPSPTDGKVHLYLEATYFCSVSRPRPAGIPPGTCRCTTRHCSHKCARSHGLLLGRHLSLRTAEQVTTFSPTEISPRLHLGGPIHLSHQTLQGSLSSVIHGRKVKLRMKFSDSNLGKLFTLPQYQPTITRQHLHQCLIKYTQSSAFCTCRF